MFCEVAMKTFTLWLGLLAASVGSAAPPAAAPDVAVISCTHLTNTTHLTVTAWSTSAVLDPDIFATGECAVILANLMAIDYDLQLSSGNGSGNTVYTLTIEGK
ncbi:hypothetical protein [Amphritea sp. HPY]|uniref:hypothetical protein n=1 Tax=Amphritea sp. HPY TaxID=3421652 RepID=UPI003D7EAE4D